MTKLPFHPRLLGALCIFLSTWPAAAWSQTPETGVSEVAGAEAPFSGAIVQVEATLNPPDLYQPWTRQPAQRVSGTGVLIAPGKVLTNAHVVCHATQILLRDDGNGTRAGARVVLISTEMDLALLEVDPADQAEFSEGKTPIERSLGLPVPQSGVEVFGYPQGGQSVSVTRGIVSRVEYAEYAGNARGLRVQVDAAVNPGNSGGPAMADGKMIGLVFGRLGHSAQNIGYVIPNEEIDYFLRGMQTGRHQPKTMLNIGVQDLTYPALRASLGVPARVTGVRIARVSSTLENFPLQVDDVLTHVEGRPVDNTGMIRDASGLRLLFAAAVQRQQEKGEVEMTVFRAGKSLEISAPLSLPQPRLVPELGEGFPEYFIYGPIVFSAATADLYADPENGMWPWFLAEHANPLITRHGDSQQVPGEQLVCITGSVLSHPITRHLQVIGSMVVATVNGVQVRNMRHLVELLRDCREEFVRIGFASTGEVAVLRRADVERASPEILESHGIRRRASPELLEVWESATKG
jgi:S1-C subfamily serine protease